MRDRLSTEIATSKRMTLSSSRSFVVQFALLWLTFMMPLCSNSHHESRCKTTLDVGSTPCQLWENHPAPTNGRTSRDVFFFPIRWFFLKETGLTPHFYLYIGSRSMIYQMMVYIYISFNLPGFVQWLHNSTTITRSFVRSSLSVTLVLFYMDYTQQTSTWINRYQNSNFQ